MAWRPNRRSFIKSAAAFGVTQSSGPGDAQPRASLLSAPVEMYGAWGGSRPEAAKRVVLRTREACLAGARLLSDRQPEALRVDNHFDGPPSIWLHADPARTAWVIVDIDPRDWCKLAYQFGHELGHVLANSWNAAASPRPPCQWLEEAMVEAFSIRGLAILAADWERDPPFTDDSAFSGAIRKYRADLIDKYRQAGGQAPSTDLAAWFAADRATLDDARGLSDSLGPAVIAILAALESDIACVEDLGALNRWSARTGLPIAAYLKAWQASCAELNAAGMLPATLQRELGVA